MPHRACQSITGITQLLRSARVSVASAAMVIGLSQTALAQSDTPEFLEHSAGAGGGWYSPDQWKSGEPVTKDRLALQTLDEARLTETERHDAYDPASPEKELEVPGFSAFQAEGEFDFSKFPKRPAPDIVPVHPGGSLFLNRAFYNDPCSRRPFQKGC